MPVSPPPVQTLVDAVRKRLEHVLKHQGFTVSTPDSQKSPDAVVQVTVTGSALFQPAVVWYMSEALARQLSATDEGCAACLARARAAAWKCLHEAPVAAGIGPSELDKVTMFDFEGFRPRIKKARFK